MYSCLHKYTKITNTCMTIKAKAIGMNEIFTDYEMYTKN